MPHKLNSYCRSAIERCKRCFWLAAVFGTAALFCSITAPAHASPSQGPGQWQWSKVHRVVVVPDIHGAYPELTELLKASGVVNESLQWIAGETHLVSLGDLLDRGAESRKVMELLMRLQAEALNQGGRVHVVAGNHEIMNLVGDLRYVAAAEFAAFADIESADQRQDAYQDFLGQRSEAIALGFLGGGPGAAERDPKTQQDFLDLYPPGYFGHRSGFAPEGLYGRWLLTLPAMIVINNTVFVHGGLPAITATASIDELNRKYHTELRRFFILWRSLIDAGVLTQDSILTNLKSARSALRIADPSTCPRDVRRACLRERGRATDEQRSPDPATLAALKELLELADSPMYGPSGPQWYRGSVRCKDIFEMPVLQAALDNLGAERVVVGHTPTTDRLVHRIRDEKVIMLDTGMLTSRYRGRPAALLIEGNTLEVQYLNPLERVPPLLDGGNGFYPFNDAKLQAALRDADVLEVDKGLFTNTSHLKLSYQGVELEALFIPEDKQGADKRELAAYRLDALLNFELVPVTVAREIDGDRGVLQLSSPKLLKESKRLRDGIEDTGWCPLPEQRQLLEVFDLLIGNTARSNTTIGYYQPLWNLQAFGHGKAFSRHGSLPRSASERALKLPGAVRASLLSLDEDRLSNALGNLLNHEQIAALLTRRDALLSIMQDPGESYDHPEKAARDGKLP